MRRRAGLLIRMAVTCGALVAVVGCLSGCGDKKANPTLPGAHPEKWMDKASVDFHGNVVSANGYASCVVCHGSDFDGGRVDVSCIDCHRETAMLCITCHGGEDNNSGAPPVGLEGETADTALAVGAHTPHLEGRFITDGIECGACHHVPAFILDSLHLNGSNGQAYDGIAEISWHGIADGGGATWNRVTRTCTDTYCHGNFPGGYHPNEPVWTANSQAHCGSCHDIGYDPASLLWKHEFHMTVANLFCADCHAAVVDTAFDIIGRDLHVNGEVDTLTRDTAICGLCHSPGAANCVACHGGMDNQTGAPPLGLRGETQTNQLAVGAHTTHLEGGSIADAFTCNECHLVPTMFADPGHYDTDSIAEITWGTLAGVSATWNRGTADCASVYCHGNFAGGYASNSPVWTATGQATCGSCHDVGTSPGDLLGRHDKHVRDKDIDCYHCHAATVNASLDIIGPDRHVDGTFDVVFFEQGNYSDGTCSGLGNDCHGSKDWYKD